MKRLAMCSFAIVALLGLRSYLLWRSAAPPQSTEPVGMSSILELQTAAARAMLPIEDIEDLSLIYPSAPMTPFSKSGREARIREKELSRDVD
jgi:hypothetical protein